MSATSFKNTCNTYLFNWLHTLRVSGAQQVHEEIQEHEALRVSDAQQVHEEIHEEIHSKLARTGPAAAGWRAA